MKTIILLIALTLGAIAAESTVHYDTTSNGDKPEISKPNHPSDELY